MPELPGGDVALLDTLTRYEIFRAADDSDLDVTDIVGYGCTGNGWMGEPLNCGQPQSPEGVKRHGRNRFEFVADRMNGAVPSVPHDPTINIVPEEYVSPGGSQLAFAFDNGFMGNDAFDAYLDQSDLGFGTEEVGGITISRG